MLNFSDACERNKRPILEALSPLFTDCHSVLELGSHSGQHAFYFAQQLPHLSWQLSDRPVTLEALTHNHAQAKLANVFAPIALDVANEEHWPTKTFNAVYSANTLHIMSAEHVQSLFQHLPKVCDSNTLLVIYGPFNYQGQYTSESNEKFQQWLQDRDPLSGIRDFEWVNELAKAAGFVFEADIKMPANNQLLVWRMQ
ncbi:DUF938 domain-containing protein [Thalassotalea piscium]